MTLAELDDLLTVSATYESWEFRWAYVVRYAQDFRLTVEQRRVLLDKTLAQTQDHHNFYVAPLRGEPPLDRSLAAEQRVDCAAIDSDGNETRADEPSRSSEPGAIERTYFPYTSVWRQAFRIQFPKTASDGRPTIAPDASWLGFASLAPRGTRSSHWDIDRSRSGATARIDGSDVPLSASGCEELEQERLRRPELLRRRAICGEDDCDPDLRRAPSWSRVPAERVACGKTNSPGRDRGADPSRTIAAVPDEQEARHRLAHLGHAARRWARACAPQALHEAQTHVLVEARGHRALVTAAHASSRSPSRRRSRSMAGPSQARPERRLRPEGERRVVGGRVNRSAVNSVLSARPVAPRLRRPAP